VQSGERGARLDARRATTRTGDSFTAADSGWLVMAAETTCRNRQKSSKMGECTKVS